MAGSVMLQSLCCITPHSPRCYKNQTVAFSHSQLFSSNSFLRLKKQSLVSALQINKWQRARRSVPVVFAAQTNFLIVVRTVWKVGRDGIEAGTNLVPWVANLDSWFLSSHDAIGGSTEVQGGTTAPPLARKSFKVAGVCPSALPWRCPPPVRRNASATQRPLLFFVAMLRCTQRVFCFLSPGQTTSFWPGKKKIQRANLKPYFHRTEERVLGVQVGIKWTKECLVLKS